MALPLAGIKVLDFTVAFSGPLTTMMLGDMGADVIKIERLHGEATRRGLGAGMDELLLLLGEEYVDTCGWLALNRSKRSLAIDIRHERGKEIVLKLAKDADVIVECFRPGVMDRLGLGYEAVSRINPKIIYSSLSGYGDAGPYAHRIGGDMWAQAMGGVVSLQGSLNGPPYLCSVGFVDQGGAAILAYGIMVALFGRERTE